MRRLFILRPEPGASATAERARALGMEPVTVPLFTIVPVEWDAPDPARFDGLLLTSANAVRNAGDQLHKLAGLRVHAVGAATAAAARNAGLEVATIGQSDVAGLLRSLDPRLRLLHLCGEHRRTVEKAAQPVTPLVVYRSDALENPTGLEDLRGEVALLHSPRAATRLAEIVQQPARAAVRLAAISAATAEAAGAGWARVEAAETPSDEALLALAMRLCENEF